MSKFELSKGSPWEGRSKALAIIFIVAGLVTMFVSPLAAAVALQVGLLGTGAGITSIGLGCLAIWMSIKSDGKMTSIANLEFHEKGAMIQEYETYFRNNFDVTKFERFKWDLEALAHVARWANKEKRASVCRSVDTILGSVDKKATKDGIERIRFLSSKISGQACKGG